MIFDRFGFLQFFLRLSHWTFSTNWLFVLRYSPCRQYRKRTRFLGVHFAENHVILLKNSKRTSPNVRHSVLNVRSRDRWTHVKWHSSWVWEVLTFNLSYDMIHTVWHFQKFKKNSGGHQVSTWFEPLLALTWPSEEYIKISLYFGVKLFGLYYRLYRLFDIFNIYYMGYEKAKILCQKSIMQFKT